MKHIDVAQVVRNGGGDDEARRHLQACPSCRRAVDALLEAERRLGGNAEVLSVAEREGILERVLLATASEASEATATATTTTTTTTATTAPSSAATATTSPGPHVHAGDRDAPTVPRPQATPSLGERLLAWLRRGWPLAIPAAAAAVILMWPRLQGADDFVARSGGGVNTPVTLFCVDGDAIHTASSATPCAPTDEVVVRVHLAAAADVHVFARGLRSDEPPSPGTAGGTAVAAGADVVLEGSWRHVDGTTDDAAQLTVVACEDRCDRATAQGRADAVADVDGVWHISVPWTAP